MARLPDREKLFKWVGPIGPDDWIMLAKADSKITLETLDDARKYKIGAYKGDAIAETLTKQGLKPVVVLRDQDNAKKLVSGQIDLWATGDPAGRYLARQEGVNGLKTVLRFNSAELYLALNKDVPDETVAKLQAALDQLRKEGVVDDIMAGISDLGTAETLMWERACSRTRMPVDISVATWPLREQARSHFLAVHPILAMRRRCPITAHTDHLLDINPLDPLSLQLREFTLQHRQCLRIRMPDHHRRTLLLRQADRRL
jgi:hypothetical protein